ncbi:hypothetical protein ASPZODRAFT_132564 [Penicilliopsis zonata CBS 506.65]|uniref:DUF3533 domain-containing protein n=1 Tax=Penicilliopsis zonata CBS 506.65 TaxID=1073090 RepID=A0A1L9SH17_9EURO|nr:hypothetical protein ASPZODRAFT_132564 [Penicilliopsis zonata CBS 506.65]OJJ46489.1 hypothetical protein ASPZODRAFT_132564 [Penicilliopsis zonata CBS 506.65]
MTYDEAYNHVWRGDAWAAVIAMPNASTNLHRAITNDNTTTYDSTTALTYIWNQAHWPMVAEGYITPSLEEAVDGASSLWIQTYGAALLEATSESNLSSTGIRLLLDGFGSTSVDIQPFPIGVRPFLSTAAMVFPALLEFFFSMALRGASDECGLPRGRLALQRHYLLRGCAMLIFSCLMGISWGLWHEVFHEHSGISGSQFCLIWLTFWMYGIIAFVVYDSATAALPTFLFPPLVLTYIIINVTAAAFPIPLKPAFFHLDYIWPSYNCFELYTTILTHGSTSRVYRNVPVLFGWLIVWIPINLFLNKRRFARDVAQLKEEE